MAYATRGYDAESEDRVPPTPEVPQMTPPAAVQTVPQAMAQARPECTECGGTIPTTPTLAGEILDCPDCGAELEVRSVQPLTLALAPQVEEDWGE
jgi:alpha-aminoadipate carrier protein LysW